jgi:2-methylisocitrate lyase-like PEP mutase family enzyme
MTIMSGSDREGLMIWDQKARLFASLHRPGAPLILYNVWDPGSAAAVAAAGAEAIATGSSPVAQAHGFPDGERIPIELALANSARVVAAVELPVTIDFEGAYAVEPDAAAANVARLKQTGAVGCNFEDQVIGGDGLHPLRLQARRIRAIRDAVGDLFFLNARTDLFMKAKQADHDAALVDGALERARAFADSGASGLFVPGLGDLALLERLCAASPLPVNVIVFPGAPPAAKLAEAGAARISHGPFPWKQAMAALKEAAAAALRI